MAADSVAARVKDHGLADLDEDGLTALCRRLEAPAGNERDGGVHQGGLGPTLGDRHAHGAAFVDDVADDDAAGDREIVDELGRCRLSRACAAGASP